MEINGGVLEKRVQTPGIGDAIGWLVLWMCATEVHHVSDNGGKTWRKARWDPVRGFSNPPSASK